MINWSNSIAPKINYQIGSARINEIRIFIFKDYLTESLFNGNYLICFISVFVKITHQTRGYKKFVILFPFWVIKRIIFDHSLEKFIFKSPKFIIIITS